MCNKDDVCGRQASLRLSPDRVVAVVNACLRQFYQRLYSDELLAPVLSASIDDPEEHLRVVVDYWCRTLLGTECPHLHATGTHVALPLDLRCLDRWERLFVETVYEVMPGQLAARMIARAERLVRDIKEGRFDAAPYQPGQRVLH